MSAVVSGAPSRYGCPRCPHRSSTRSSPTWSPPGRAAWWPATRAASCRWGVGSAGAALKDTFLQEALKIATTKFIDLRKESFAGFPQGEALRDRARAIKEATLQHLDVHL